MRTLICSASIDTLLTRKLRSQVDRPASRLVLENLSAEYRTTAKENYNFENKTCKAYLATKPLTRLESHTPLAQQKPVVLKDSTLGNTTSHTTGTTSALKSFLARYKKPNTEPAKSINTPTHYVGLRHVVETHRESVGYTSALMRFRNLKHVPNTFR